MVLVSCNKGQRHQYHHLLDYPQLSSINRLTCAISKIIGLQSANCLLAIANPELSHLLITVTNIDNCMY